jgi:hypothetical protein
MVPDWCRVRAIRVADYSAILCEQEDNLMERIFDVLILIVVVAIVVAIVTHSESATIINSLGSSFSNSITAALGNTTSGS